MAKSGRREEKVVLPWELQVSHGHPDYASWYGHGRFAHREEALEAAQRLKPWNGWYARWRIIGPYEEAQEDDWFYCPKCGYARKSTHDALGHY